MFEGGALDHTLGSLLAAQEPTLATSRHSLHRHCRLVQCMAAGGKNSRKKAKRPGQFEVKVITPPPRSLGVHVLPPDTHNGDQIEVDGLDYVVSGVVLQYKLVRGRYEREHNRLEVQSTGRYITNAWLQHLMDSSPAQ
eukprot:jgi/Botrbrau1/13254/Bobra.0074s0003.1